MVESSQAYIDINFSGSEKVPNKVGENNETENSEVMDFDKLLVQISQV